MHTVFFLLLFCLSPWGPNIYLTNLHDISTWEFNMSKLTTLKIEHLLPSSKPAFDSPHFSNKFHYVPNVQAKDLEIVLDSCLFQTTPILPSYQIHLQVLLAMSAKYILNLFTFKANPPWSLTWTVATASESVHLLYFCPPRIWFT